MPNDEVGNEVQSASSAKQDVSEHMIPKGRLDEVISERETLKKKVEALEKAQQEIERKRLEETNDYKKLYESAQSELTTMKPKAEKVDEYESALAEVLKSQIAELPEEFKDVIPEGLPVKAQLDWLVKNKIKFMKPEAPEIGAGKLGVKKTAKPTDLTEEERSFAKSFGMNEEDYAKSKFK